MNHNEALQTFAVEKYLLNELKGRERNEFEEHFFECQECALDVRSGAAFIGQARRELSSAPQQAPAGRRTFFSMFSLPLAGLVMAGLAMVVVYQNAVTLPGLRGQLASANAPAALSTTSLIGGASRGGDLPSVDASVGRPLFLNVDVPTDDRYSSYQLKFSDQAGSAEGTITVSPDQAKNTLLVRLPANGIHDGIHTLVIEGATGDGSPAVKLAQYRFRVLNVH